MRPTSPKPRWSPLGAALALALAACGGPGPGAAPVDPGAAVGPGTPASPGTPADPGTPSDPGAGDPGTVVGPSLPAVAVAFATGLEADALTPATAAAIDDTPQLWLVADWTGVDAAGAEKLVLTSPQGTVFADLELGFSGARGDVRIQSLADGRLRVAWALQIWGTSIEMYRRTGTWSATVSLSGGDLSGQASVSLR